MGCLLRARSVLQGQGVLALRYGPSTGAGQLLWALSFPTVTLFKPVLPTQTPQLDSHECPQPEGHRRCAKLHNSTSLNNGFNMLLF